MAGLNRVMLIGNLGDDPEIRSLNSGDQVANMRIATSENWKDRDGNKQERTEWHTVVCFNQGLIGVIESYLRKGSKVYVAGQLQTRKWQDNSGADKYTTEVVLQRFGSELVLLDSAGGGGGRDRDRDDDRGGYGGRSGGRDDDRGGRGGGRDDRSGGRSGGGRDTRNDRGGGQGSFDDDHRSGRSSYGAGGGDTRGGGGRGRPAPAFDSDLDDDVPF